MSAILDTTGYDNGGAGEKFWSHTRQRTYPTPQCVKDAARLRDKRKNLYLLTTLQRRYYLGMIIDGRTTWDLATAHGVTRSSVKEGADRAVAILLELQDCEDRGIINWRVRAKVVRGRQVGG